MPGPCPNGQPTEAAHKAARCRDKERCTGPGCRLRRKAYVDPLLAAIREDQRARAAMPV